MRFVNDKIHGVIDYVAAIALIAVPLAANFEAVSPVSHWLSIFAGAGLLLYSLLTSYTYSVTGVISFGLHLAFDFAAGLVFLAAPFAFGFGGFPRVFYLISGAAVVLLVIITDPRVESASRETVETEPEAFDKGSNEPQDSSDEVGTSAQ